jgi:hypothetical protein
MLPAEILFMINNSCLIETDASADQCVSMWNEVLEMAH